MKFNMTEERLVELRHKGARYEAGTNGVSTSTGIDCYIMPSWEDRGPEQVLEEIARACCYEPEFDDPHFVFSDYDLTDEEIAFIQSIPPSGLPKTHVKWKWKKLGGHVHVRCFSITPPGTWALNGTLCFDEAEWERMVSSNNSVVVYTTEDE